MYTLHPNFKLSYSSAASEVYKRKVEALKRFMLNNLHQPDDISEGEKLALLAQFVVDKNGNISDVQILQNAREDLDAEVMRVINRMPKWKAGSQNGNPVAVYYKMPISFVNNN